MRLAFVLCFILGFILAACSAPSPETYRERGSTLVRALLKELQQVHSREELMDHEAEIRHLFQELTHLVLEAEIYVQAHPEREIPLFSRYDQKLSDELQTELNRLLRKEGCQELLNELMSRKVKK